MAIKTTGAQLKAFYSDDAYWPKESYWDGDITADGTDLRDLEYEHIPDEAIVVIGDGSVLSQFGGDLGTIQSFFKKWLKKQSQAQVLVSCPKDKLMELKAALKSLGAKILVEAK